LVTRAGVALGVAFDVHRYTGFVKLSIELEREDDGRWIAEASELPGVMTYGTTRSIAATIVSA
jgi:hypothetical protein